MKKHRSIGAQMRHGDRNINLMAIALSIKDNQEFMRTKKGFKLFSECLGMLKECDEFAYDVLSEMLTKGSLDDRDEDLSINRYKRQ